MKSLHISIETQTEDEELISLVFINEKMLALEGSDVANIIFKNNNRLFRKINKRTTLSKAVIYRREMISKTDDVTKLGTRMNRGGNYIEKEACRLIFDNNIIRKQSRLITNAGNKIDYFPDSLKVFNGRTVLDNENLTQDDVDSSTILTTLQELPVNLGRGIKCILFNDHAVDRESLENVSYRVELQFSTFFDKYINFVLKEIDESILFLQSLYNTIVVAGHYDSSSFKFKENYSNQIYESLGISSISTKTNLNDDRIKSSGFGRAGLAFHNGTLLLQSSIDPRIYKNILMNIIPNNKTNPDIINQQVKKFMTLRDNISKSYLVVEKSSSSFSKISSKPNTGTTTIVTVSDNFEIEKDKIGYNIFSENQTGLNQMSANSYIDRFLAEQRKYYPGMSTATDSTSMTKAEASDFRDTSKRASFLTPANLVYGNKKITTSRGVNNIDPVEIKRFRIAKSQKAIKKRKSRLGLRQSSSRINDDTMSNFNLTISTPKRGLIERSINEKIDPLIDAKYYIGEDSFFVTSNPNKILTNFKRINLRKNTKIFEIVSSVIPRRFLKNKKSLRSSSEIRIANKNSVTRKLLVDKRIEFKKIPPQIKYMMSNSFYKTDKLDPLKNLNVAPIIEETQKNLYVVKALVGFQKDRDGNENFNRPIYKEIELNDVGSKVMIAKAYDYEVPELGIVKDTFMPTIYNNLLLLGI